MIPTYLKIVEQLSSILIFKPYLPGQMTNSTKTKYTWQKKLGIFLFLSEMYNRY